MGGRRGLCEERSYKTLLYSRSASDPTQHLSSFPHISLLPNNEEQSQARRTQEKIERQQELEDNEDDEEGKKEQQRQDQ